MAEVVQSSILTVSDVMNIMAPHAGGTVPDNGSEEYANWLRFIQMKYEEASRRASWRRLLQKSTISLTAGDTEALLPVDFPRANALFILYVDEVDLCDPDREVDDQDIFVQMITDPTDENFARWKVTFDEEVETTQTAPIWYFCTPPKPTAADDKLLLPGDMIAFGALSEVFRSTNLEGSQDDARNEFENRLTTYLSVEMVPGRNEVLRFITNPRGTNRSAVARSRYQTPRGSR